MSEDKVKIDVYLTLKEKEDIVKRAKDYGLTTSTFVKIKALDLLKEKNG